MTDQPTPEYLGDEAPPPGKKRRTGLLIGSGVVAAAAIGAGAWGFALLSGGGPGAAAVLPDSVLGYAAIDLDPSAGQKIEALETLNKFPAFKDEVGLGSRDDLRAFFIETIQSEGECEGLDYEADIAPWLGDKVAVAAYPNDETFADPVFALQVTDEDAAEDGIARFFEECGEESFGVAFSEDYAIVAETEDIANAVVEDAAEGVLSDSDAYNEAMDALDGVGVFSLYVSDEIVPFAESFTEGMELGEDETFALEQFASFEGAAATLRFDDGGVEFAVAGTGMGMGETADETTVGDLPGSTIGALGFSLSADSLNEYLDQLREGLGPELYDSGLAEGEQALGIDLPEDLITLFSSGLVLAVDGENDWAALGDAPDPSGFRAGIRVDSDSDEVRSIVDRLLVASGAPPELIQVSEGNGRIAVGFEPDYLDSLVEGGDLEGEGSFSDNVVEADRAGFIFYVDFDTEDWLEELVGAFDDQEIVENIRPLDALGISQWQDGDTTHVVVKVSTD